MVTGFYVGVSSSTLDLTEYLNYSRTALGIEAESPQSRLLRGEDLKRKARLII